MRSNKDKIAQICAMGWIYISDADIEDHPGSTFIYVSGEWEAIPFSKAEFKEEIPGSGRIIKQELSATITGLNQAQEASLRKMVAGHGLIRLDYTNGDSKVIGSEQVPIKISLEINGSPSTYSLSVKRSSPEPSKFFKSF